MCANLKNEGWELIIFVRNIRINEVITKIFGLAKERGIVDAEEMINSTDTSWQQKLRNAIKMFLAETRVAIIFDNFEDNQEPDTGNVTPELKEFIEICNDLQGHGSVLFITTRYNVPGLHRPVELQDFTAIETRKMFFQFKALAKLEDKQVSNIHKKIGANPRVLELLETLAAEEFGNDEFDIELFEDIIDEAVKIVTGDNKTEEAFAPWFIGRLVSYLNDEEKELLKTVSLYRLPVKSEGLFMDKGRTRKTSKKLQRLSLIVYIPTDTYFAHRLTSDYVVRNMFEEAELRRQRKKAGKYMENVNSYEAIYQYREAGEVDSAFEIANGIQDHLKNHGYVYEARGLLEDFLSMQLTEKNKGMLFHSIGIIENRQGNPEKALRYFNGSLEIKEKLGDISGIAQTKGQTGILYTDIKKYREALECFIEAYLIFKKIGSPNRKRAAVDILKTKKFVEEEVYNNILMDAGIDTDELATEGQPQENPLKPLTMSALSGGQESGERIKGILGSVPQEALDTEEGKTIHAYITYLHDLAHAEDKTAFIKSSDKDMVGMMVGLVGKENVPGL